MDKSTLSNYGWIVIAVLVLAVMMALATPFGTYVKAGVESTTQGLFDTSEKAMNVVGMSAKGDGGSGSVVMLEGDGQVINKSLMASPLRFRSSADINTFQSVKINGETVDPSNYVVTEGSTIITFNHDYVQAMNLGKSNIEIVSDVGTATANFIIENDRVVPEGVVYTCNDSVIYCDVCPCDLSELGGSAELTCYCGKYTGADYKPNTVLQAGDIFPDGVRDGDIIEYGDYEYRYGYGYCDNNCCLGWTKIGQCWSPVHYDGWCVRYIGSSKTPSNMLESINNTPIVSLRCTFFDDFQKMKITSAPKIPNSVIDMYGTFMGCMELSGSIEVNANLISLNSTFYQTQKEIVLTGASPDLALLAQTSPNGNVTVQQ